MRQRVALTQPAFRSDVFITAGERNRLERDEGNLLRIVHRETDDRADLIVIDAIDQHHNENDLNTRFVQIVDRAQFHVEKIPDLAMTVGVVPYTVELEIHKSQTRFGSLSAKLFTLGELDAIGC